MPYFFIKKIGKQNKLCNADVGASTNAEAKMPMPRFPNGPSKSTNKCGTNRCEQLLLIKIAD